MHDILTFFQQLRDNKKAAEINKKLKDPVDYFCRQGEHTFYMSSRYWAPGLITRGGNGVIPLIKLDSEDIEYFVNKYSARLQKELDDKISDIQKGYTDIINKED